MKKHLRIIILLLLCLMAVSCSKKKPQTVAKPTVEVEVEKPTVDVDVPEPTVEIEVAEPTVEVEVAEPTVEVDEPIVSIDENGTYTSRDDVALYINTYGKLPSNFITKKEAKKLGWEGGSLEEYAPGKSIGGDYFGNYEELLPEKKGREYHECDIDTKGKKKRGAKRIIYSNDGLIYYTDDHYKTFTLLYGEE